MKRLPMIDSWTHRCPLRSLLSAARQAIFALSPVPQGERSYSPPGHSTKLRPVTILPGGSIEQFDVVDHLEAALLGRRIDAVDPVSFERSTDLAGHPAEFAQLRRGEVETVILHQEEPVPSPGDVTGDGAQPLDIDLDVLLVPETDDILNRNQ